MKFGVRDIVEVVLRAKSKQRVGKRTFYRNDPVIYFDSLTTASLEGAATTVYAQGGRGNARLLAWEGERTLTFNMTDALLSPESFMILSGAGLIDASTETEADEYQKPLYVHTTSQVEVKKANEIIIPEVACWSHSGEMANGYYHDGADIFVMVLTNGEVDSEPRVPTAGGVHHGKMVNGAFVPITAGETPECTLIECTNGETEGAKAIPAGSIVLVDYYIKRTSGVKQIEITPDQFGGYFYLEGSTLFRRESDGVDLAAEIVIPKVKIQSNFTFTMAATGDPSTFDFVMDAFPDYTKFDGTKQVLAIMQIIEDEEDAEDINSRRHHSVDASEVAAATAEDFDHWRTYGAQGRFGKLDSDGAYTYVDSDGNSKLEADSNDPEKSYNADIKKRVMFNHMNTFDIPAGSADQAVSKDLSIGVFGGIGTITYSATGLPSWLNLSSSTGVLSGTTEVGDATTATITATDSARNSASIEIAIGAITE